MVLAFSKVEHDVDFVLWASSTRADGLTTEKKQKKQQKNIAKYLHSCKQTNKRKEGFTATNTNRRKGDPSWRMSLIQGDLRLFSCVPSLSFSWLGFLVFDILQYLSKERREVKFVIVDGIKSSAQGVCWDGDYFFLFSCSLNCLLPLLLACLAFSCWIWYGREGERE